MELLHYDTPEEAMEAGAVLRGLGGAAVRLLRQAVEAQELKRARVSRAALRLEDKGFLFVVEGYAGDEYALRPSLAGEEALEMLDHAQGDGMQRQLQTR